MSDAHPIPMLVNRCRVRLHSLIDERHRPTDACRHTVNGVPLGPVAALAIAQADGDPGFFLYRCDSEYLPLTDTWHPSLEEAMEQAELEYEGVRLTWREASA